MSAQEAFDEAVKYIRSLPEDGPFKPSTDVKLKLYALFKQVNEGECKISKPGLFDITGRKKWEAWNSLGSISKEEAMEKYVQEFNLVKAQAEKAINGK